MKLTPKTRRNIARIVPFAVIWLVTGWIFILVETAAMGTVSPDSPTIINLTWTIFLFASISVIIVGLLFGFMELVFVEKLFRERRFLSKIFSKFALYFLMMLVIITITYPIAASFESGLSILDKQVWEKFYRYLGSVTFLSTLLQMACSMFLCIIYAAISEHLGHSVLLNFFTGKYHSPKEEKRLFMFLDMSSSTAIAEKLGHTRYFELLRAYYADLSDAIINHQGEVYQYVGDEVVISWKYKDGLKDNNCIRCFFAMKRGLQQRASYYHEKFDVIPEFKAGVHLGDVTTGEIGALKKEIFFTGDVLNVTARLQSLCKEYQAELLTSGELAQQLHTLEYFKFQSLGNINLKGRSGTMEIFVVEEN
ncbi:MAG: adenylate/guanylate cyclase domain-containing protein [Flavobacteriaceae bacterium]|nr:adenylate/guanylate cyclase domain-containing protein [Flavobacteriaceae bacterium]